MDAGRRALRTFRKSSTKEWIRGPRAVVVMRASSRLFGDAPRGAGPPPVLVGLLRTGLLPGLFSEVTTAGASGVSNRVEPFPWVLLEVRVSISRPFSVLTGEASLIPGLRRDQRSHRRPIYRKIYSSPEVRSSGSAGTNRILDEPQADGRLVMLARGEMANDG